MLYTWPHENGTICPFGVFVACFVVVFVQFEANPCAAASCGLIGFPCFVGMSAVVWVLGPEFTLWPFRLPKWPFLHSQNTIV